MQVGLLNLTKRSSNPLVIVSSITSSSSFFFYSLISVVDPDGVAVGTSPKTKSLDEYSLISSSTFLQFNF